MVILNLDRIIKVLLYIDRYFYLSATSVHAAHSEVIRKARLLAFAIQKKSRLEFCDTEKVSPPILRYRKTLASNFAIQKKYRL